jgi:hypothetical protein
VSRRVGVAALATATLTAGCVTPARNEPQYSAKAVAAVQAAASEVATGLLVVGEDRHGKVLRPYADRVVSGSENALGSIGQSFGSVQPPNHRSDAIRDAVSRVLSDAQDALGHARIAVRRSDRAGLDASDRELRSVAAELRSAEQKLQ